MSILTLDRPEAPAPDLSAELAEVRAEVASLRRQLAAARRAHDALDALDCAITAAGVTAGRALELAADIEYRAASASAA